jgi:hypothetical protein
VPNQFQNSMKLRKFPIELVVYNHLRILSGREVILVAEMKWSYKEVVLRYLLTSPPWQDVIATSS